MWTNWSGALESHPRATHRPLDEAGVVAAVRQAADRGRRVRPVGAGHSWSPLVVTDDVALDCSALTGIVAIAGDRVRVRAGATLAALHLELAGHGRALAVVPDSAVITVAGAAGTGTHGSGAAIGSLSAQITGARLVDGTGGLRTVRGTDLDAVRVGLGALGVLTEVELRTVPLHRMQVQEGSGVATDLLVEGGVFDTHEWAEVEIHLPSGEALARWGDPADPDADAAATRLDLVRTAAAGSAEALGRMLPRLAPRLWRTARWGGATVGAPHELFVETRSARRESAEWALPRPALGQALRELRSAAVAAEVDLRAPIVVRVGPPETGWLHPAQGRATAWVSVRSPRGTDPTLLFALTGAVLSAAGGRPHWAGHHDWTVDQVAAAYPHLADFCAVRDRYDPDRRFTNPHLATILGP